MQNVDCGMRSSVCCDVWCDDLYAFFLLFLFYLFFCHPCFLCRPRVAIYLETQMRKVMAAMMHYMGVVKELNRNPVLRYLVRLLTMNPRLHMLLKLFLICLMCFDS